jgi:hypothetical protein
MVQIAGEVELSLGKDELGRKRRGDESLLEERWSKAKLWYIETKLAPAVGASATNRAQVPRQPPALTWTVNVSRTGKNLCAECQ